jgi:hypothetical protein
VQQSAHDRDVSGNGDVRFLPLDRPVTETAGAEGLQVGRFVFPHAVPVDDDEFVGEQAVECVDVGCDHRLQACVVGRQDRVVFRHFRHL